MDKEAKVLPNVLGTELYIAYPTAYDFFKIFRIFKKANKL
jgi:hypothetical protein